MPDWLLQLLTWWYRLFGLSTQEEFHQFFAIVAAGSFLLAVNFSVRFAFVIVAAIVGAVSDAMQGGTK